MPAFTAVEAKTSQRPSASATGPSTAIDLEMSVRNARLDTLIGLFRFTF